MTSSILIEGLQRHPGKVHYLPPCFFCVPNYVIDTSYYIIACDLSLLNLSAGCKIGAWLCPFNLYIISVFTLAPEWPKVFGIT